MKRFFISDTHFGHFNVIGYSERPFVFSEDESIPLSARQKNLVEEMNQFMIDRWNSVVSENDTVYFVGDFAFCGTQEMKKILDQLKGTKILIKGNHDRSEKQMISVGFSQVHDTLELNLSGYEVILNHYPYVDMEFYDVAQKRPHIIKYVTSPNLVNPKVPKDLDYNQMKKWLSEALKKPVNSQADGSKEYIIQLQRLISRYIGTRLINEGKILLHGHTHHKQKRFANMINCSVEAWDFTPASEDQIVSLIQDYEKDLTGENISYSNFQDPVWDYYKSLERKLFKLERFKVIDELATTYDHLDYYKENFKTLNVPKNYSRKWYDLNLQNKGFIPQSKLVDGFYQGNCRNAEWAYWRSDLQKFYYLRYKFGHEFIEDIECLEKDNGFDVFIPYSVAELPEEEKQQFLTMLKKYLKED